MSFQQILGRQSIPLSERFKSSGSFIFGGNTGETYESLQKKRAMGQSMASGLGQAPRNIGEGINALGKAFAARSLMKQAGNGEAMGQADFDGKFSSSTGGEAFGRLFNDLLTGKQGGQAQGRSAPQGSGEPSAWGQTDPNQAFNASLSRTESGGNYNITNSEGYGGKYQFGQARLDDFNRAMGTRYKVADLTAGSKESAALTEAVQEWHIGDIDSFIESNDLSKYIGQNIGGVTMTQNGMRAMAHLGGVGGMKKFLTSGGQHNPADSNGTSLRDYARTHGSAGQGGAPQNASAQSGQATQGIDPRLFELLDSPYASPSQKLYIKSLLEQQIAASQPKAAVQPKIMELADGRNYYVDPTGKVPPRLVSPNMEIPVDPMDQINIDKGNIEIDKGNLELEQMSKPKPNWHTLTPDEIDAMSLPPGVYQMGPDGKIASIGKPGTSVTVNNAPGQPEVPAYNKLPAGFVYKRDENGQIIIDKDGVPTSAPIKGGPSDNSEKKGLQDQSTLREADIVIEEIDRIFDKSGDGGLPVAGAFGGLLSKLPGTDSYDVAGLLKTIKANVGFKRLQDMRDASPTGGALGAINNQEMSLLQSVLGNLEQSRSKGDFEYNLKRLRTIYTKVVHGITEDDGADAGGGAEFQQFASDPTNQALVAEYGITLEELWAEMQKSKGGQ